MFFSNLRQLITSSMGSGNDLEQYGRQAVIWINGGQSDVYSLKAMYDRPLSWYLQVEDLSNLSVLYACIYSVQSPCSVSSITSLTIVLPL